MSDNGPQFISSDFETFLKENAAKHTKPLPRHPASNGEAERFVKTLKLAMKAGEGDVGSIETKVARFLLSYRSTPPPPHTLTLTHSH